MRLLQMTSRDLVLMIPMWCRLSLRLQPHLQHCATPLGLAGRNTAAIPRLRPIPGFYEMCNLYSITTNQDAILRLIRVVNRYVGNLPPMPGVFPDYPAPVIRNAGDEREMILMRWGMP